MTKKEKKQEETSISEISANIPSSKKLLKKASNFHTCVQSCSNSFDSSCIYFGRTNEAEPKHTIINGNDKETLEEDKQK